MGILKLPQLQKQHRSKQDKQANKHTKKHRNKQNRQTRQTKAKKRKNSSFDISLLLGLYAGLICNIKWQGTVASTVPSPHVSTLRHSEGTERVDPPGQVKANSRMPLLYGNLMESLYRWWLSNCSQTIFRKPSESKPFGMYAAPCWCLLDHGVDTFSRLQPLTCRQNLQESQATATFERNSREI